MKLKYNPETCLSCEEISCLTNCQYLNLSSYEAKVEIEKIARGEYSSLLKDCVACYACEEYCRYGNHPFFRIVELQELHNVEVAPKNVVEELISKYKAEGEFKPKKVDKGVLHICLFPELKERVQSRLFEGLTVVRGRHVFCNLIYLHLGKISVIKERAKKVIENISSLGVNEVVFFHDECYAFYTTFAEAYGIEVPFKPIHLFEYLYNKLKELKDEIKELNVKVAYQRPCSNRLIPETDKVLDKLFKLIGVERVEREYDRENSLCCGTGLKLQGRYKLAEEVQRKNLDDIVKSNAEIVVFNCPMCYATLSKAVKELGLKPYLVSDLCRIAIGEQVS